MKKILQFKLKILAKLILLRYKPRVIGITGSVGKTSSKEACYAALAPDFRVRENIKNYNNEIGLPLSIIGLESAGRSLLGWINVFTKACWLIVFKDRKYPEVLVLEMGIDRPGDMSYLLSIVKPHIGIITRIGKSHLEFFGTEDKVKEEKGLLVKTLRPGQTAVLNYDYEKTKSLANTVKADIISFGFNEGASLRAQNYCLKSEGFFPGIEFDLSFKGSMQKIYLPRAIGKSVAYSILAGVAGGLACGLTLEKTVDNLKNNFSLPKGRMNLLEGINKSLLIDDSYNASPQSAISALEAMGEAKTLGKKIAVFGDMLELGGYEEEGHSAVGKAAFDNKIDLLISVGGKAKHIHDGAETAGMLLGGNMYFYDRESVIAFLKDHINSGDMVLVKGSQGARMELVVKELLADGSKAEELLVRQDSQWKGK